MAGLDEVGERDGWRCWICDEPVDPERSVNDERGPSIDRLSTKKRKGKAKEKGGVEERLAHRACNTRKGAVEAVVLWPDHLSVVDPAPILTAVERLERKGGREVVARCPTHQDGEAAAAWLADRITRLRPGLSVTTDVEAGGGEYLLVLRT